MQLTLSNHAIQRIVRRRISLDEVQAALRQKPVFRKKRGVEEYYDPETGVVVAVNPYRQIITTVYVKR